MLILSRKRDEQIIIGDAIVITVVSVRGGNVRLGIEAPSHVTVHRREVYDAIRGGTTEAKPTDTTASADPA
jgi:carbon storage regulator